MKSINKKKVLWAQIFCTLLSVFLCACATPTIENNDSENNPDHIPEDQTPVSEDSLITKDVLKYYVFDTIHSVLYHHFNGMCYAKNGELFWDPEMDHFSKYYSYNLSGDTLFFSNSTSLVKTYLRETNDGSALGGRWILQEDESDIFTPEYLIVSGLTAVWEYSIKENAPVSNTDVFTVIMQDIVAEQDGTPHPHQGDYGWGPDWYILFGKYYENHLTVEDLHEFCDPCEDIERTNSSVVFTRKQKRFEISMDNPVYNEKRMSYAFKISADGKSCTFFAELIDATEDVCPVKGYWPDELIEGHTYTSLSKLTDNDEFLECFKDLVN